MIARCGPPAGYLKKAKEGDNTVSSSRRFHKPIVENAYRHLCVRRDEPEQDDEMSDRSENY